MDPLLIPIVALFVPIVIVPTALTFRHVGRLRAYEHAERVRAMELGRVLPGDEPWWTPARISVAIGAGVPIVALLVAMVASETAGFREEIWIACGMVGLLGVIGGTYLAGRNLVAATSAEKAAYDPDAFDVVGRRG